MFRHCHGKGVEVPFIPLEQFRDIKMVVEYRYPPNFGIKESLYIGHWLASFAGRHRGSA